MLAGALAAGTKAGVAWHILGRKRTVRSAVDGAGNDSWLLAYVTLEPDGPGCCRRRASVLRLSLPEAAEVSRSIRTGAGGDAATVWPWRRAGAPPA